MYTPAKKSIHPILVSFEENIVFMAENCLNSRRRKLIILDLNLV